MKAILPLSVAAVRVNANDNSNVVNAFQGATAAFDALPWLSPGGDPLHPPTTSSTGDAVARPLESETGPLHPLGIGIHLHWELPDYFRRGVQTAAGDDIVFPPAPNRWLVIRHLTVQGAAGYGAVTSSLFVVESDYVAPALAADAFGVIRPAVSVPLPYGAPFGAQPFRYMGRVVPYAQWTPPAAAATASYLPGFTGPDGKTPLYLTAIGFSGPGFASYYPDCCSVFGFWDHFGDVAYQSNAGTTLAQALAADLPVQFKVSYQVVGWIEEAGADPLASIASDVRAAHQAYVDRCASENVAVDRTATDVFGDIADRRFHWSFDLAQVTAGNPAAPALPDGTLCSGLLQEVVWNMSANPGTAFFLANPQPLSSADPPGLWTDTIGAAIGNTTTEALSALLKADMGASADPQVLRDYEYLLNALQLGLLNGLQGQDNKLIYLDEALHTSAFTRVSAGLLWIVQQPESDSGGSDDADQQATLPLGLAEQLALLNQAQKAYDQGRARLDTLRRQLFMDWLRYVKLFTSGTPDPLVDLNTLQAFIATSGGGELNAVLAAGAATGVLSYAQDSSGQIVGIGQASPGSTSLAGRVSAALQAVATSLTAFPRWQLEAVPAPAFHLPSDPVLLMEGDRLAPVRRNGPSRDVAVRLTTELISVLSLQAPALSVPASAIPGVPAVLSSTPNAADVQALVDEGCLLLPMFAPAVGAAVQALGGTGNPAAGAALTTFVAALQAAQGGGGPLSQVPQGAGLFAAIRQPGAQPSANPGVAVAAPVALSVVFTNAAANGWAPDPIGWNAQQAVPELSASRVDPFLPVFLTWTVELNPLQRHASGSYASDVVTRSFALNADDVDYQYTVGPGGASSMATGDWLSYSGSVVLSTRPMRGLASQIDSYLQHYPADPAAPGSPNPATKTLQDVRAMYVQRNILSQALSGFNTQQTLRSYLPQIPLVNRVHRGDSITSAVAGAAARDPGDNWYDTAFNGVAPVPEGPLALGNFGPLRAGFLRVRELTVVDAFGQRMRLLTDPGNASNPMQVVSAASLQPLAADAARAALAFLPPRLLAPSRVWFRWLSAAHDTAVAGISGDFVETNTHPATSPICGWVLPNHLDNRLFLYDADGTAIGSFGLEHGAVVYRTRPGNTGNLGDSLAADIGPANAPAVNPHLSAFMWYLDAAGGPTLSDLMMTIQDSDVFINPANFAQDVHLSILVGRPLALTRAVLALETAGGAVPVSQASTSAGDPFPQDVASGRYDYSARQAASSAGLEQIVFPVRLGDVANLDDGLVGFFLGGDPTDGTTTFFSAVAPAGGANGVARPAPDTVRATLNGAPLVLTMLVDPRAGVHATTGILPVAELDIPVDQYGRALQTLAMTFFTHPVLHKAAGLVVPLPREAGFDWSWIGRAAPNSGGAPSVTPLDPNQADETAVYDYTPQRLLEGWLQLTFATTTLKK